MGFDVEYYEKPNGTYPAEEFILSQDVKMRAKIFRGLQLLEEKGNLLREPFSKHLNEGIFELRTKQGSDISRVLYFFFVDQKIVLTNGFVKKQGKTPAKEIKLAKAYRQDYLERMRKE